MGLRRLNRVDIALSSISLDTRSMSPRSLPELEDEWLKLFTEMRSNPDACGINAGRLAAPFLSTPATDAYKAGSRGTVMLVGKATSGRNTLDDAPVALAYDVETVKRRTPAVFNEVVKSVETSPFLRFGQRLSKDVAEAAGPKSEPFENLIWTNLAKIGMQSGNPGGPYLKAQMELAVETLAAEIAYYRPSLVVTAVHDFGYGPLRRAIPELWEDGPHKQASWPTYWSQSARNGRPAVLWTMHPERKEPAVLDTWSKVARHLVKEQV